jgi:pyrroloquinoline quinone biosynthesis protein B
MRIRILGSAAGGGVPQWNCRCANCEAARAGSGAVQPRTQSSVAVSADGRRWWLLNASPDIRQQILSFPPLGPGEGVRRGQGIVGCVLTDAEMDHTAGLLFLREGTSFAVLATPLVRGWLNRQLPIEPLLGHFAKPVWSDLSLGEPLLLPGEETLTIEAFEVDRHVPRFADGESASAVGSVIGLRLVDRKTAGKLVYVPCAGDIGGKLRTISVDADAVLLDGTFWSDDEPIHAGIGSRTARQMGHLPVTGAEGSLAWLSTLPAKHRVYVHINNTNPMLNERGSEHRLVHDSGVRVGTDGDTFEL